MVSCELASACLAAPPLRALQASASRTRCPAGDCAAAATVAAITVAEAIAWKVSSSAAELYGPVRRTTER
jgi:hypothetical protein